MTRNELFRMMLEAASVCYDAREARSVACVILEDFYGISRTGLALEPQARVALGRDPEEVAAQIKSGRPVQYVTGRAEFRTLALAVREGVLIPRQETEELVRWVVSESAPGARILDIGTGSGAIALALAREVEGSRVSAIDVSPEALAVARENAEANGAQVRFYRCDVLRPVEEWDGEWRAESFDIIVSNPPYIPAAELSGMHRNVVDHEPHGALFVPDRDPMLFYRAITQTAAELLAHGGSIFFEIHERMGARVTELLATAGFADIESREDMNGRDRMIRAVKR